MNWHSLLAAAGTFSLVGAVLTGIAANSANVSGYYDEEHLYGRVAWGLLALAGVSFTLAAGLS